MAFRCRFHPLHFRCLPDGAGSRRSWHFGAVHASSNFHLARKTELEVVSWCALAWVRRLGHDPYNLTIMYSDVI